MTASEAPLAGVRVDRRVRALRQKVDAVPPTKQSLGPLNGKVKHFPVVLLKELGKSFIQANPAAVELGRKGGKVGGKARAGKLSPERRSEIARNAARERWNNKENRERDAVEAWARDNGLYRDNGL